MKYILMCGGNYKDNFNKPKQLTKVNGEVLVERTIRLLKENGVDNIVISTNCNDFNYLGLPILRQDNQYEHNGINENKKSICCWLNAYYPMEEPCCYIHGDVYFSDNAIKTIVETEVKDTMFFCVRDVQDGRKVLNAKGREPLAYKVHNFRMFRNAINDILQMVDDGKYENAIAPFSWHLYRYLNNLKYISNDLGYINNIFDSKGNYVVIDDYSTDVDSPEDVEKIENIIKMVEGGVTMVKARAIEQFYLGEFNKLNNIKRATAGKDLPGYLYLNDTFECTEDMAKYLTKTNAKGRAFIEILEIIPEKKAEVKEEQPVEEKPKRTRRKKVTSID